MFRLCPREERDECGPISAVPALALSILRNLALGLRDPDGQRHLHVEQPEADGVPAGGGEGFRGNTPLDSFGSEHVPEWYRDFPPVGRGETVCSRTLRLGSRVSQESGLVPGRVQLQTAEPLQGGHPVELGTVTLSHLSVEAMVLISVVLDNLLVHYKDELAQSAA